jgi:hypothetical protein
MICFTSIFFKFFDPNFREAKETFISRKFGGVQGQRSCIGVLPDKYQFTNHFGKVE